MDGDDSDLETFESNFPTYYILTYFFVISPSQSIGIKGF